MMEMIMMIQSQKVIKKVKKEKKARKERNLGVNIVRKGLPKEALYESIMTMPILTYRTPTNVRNVITPLYYKHL